MTTCCICTAPCPGTDDDGGPLCFACFEANFAGVEVQPRPPRLRELASLVRVWGLPGDEDGREG